MRFITLLLLFAFQARATVPLARSESHDPYQVLGIGRDASDVEIKKRYRKLMNENHPDRNRDDPGAEARTKLINEAYAALQDPHTRYRMDTSPANERDPIPETPPAFRAFDAPVPNSPFALQSEAFFSAAEHLIALAGDNERAWYTTTEEALTLHSDFVRYYASRLPYLRDYRPTNVQARRRWIRALSVTEAASGGAVLSAALAPVAPLADTTSLDWIIDYLVVTDGMSEIARAAWIWEWRKRMVWSPEWSKLGDENLRITHLLEQAILRADALRDSPSEGHSLSLNLMDREHYARASAAGRSAVEHQWRWRSSSCNELLSPKRKSTRR